MARSSPSLATRVAMSLFGLTLGLSLVEGGVRLLSPQAELVPPSEASPLLRGAFTRPGEHRNRSAEFDVAVSVNQQGFVDREWGPRRPELQRVVLIGDSFVQGAQVPLNQGFGRVLDDAMPDVEVLSLGIPGAGTGTALGLLESYGLDLQPDLVLLGFLVSNDVLNNHPLLEGKPDKPFYELVNGSLRPISKAAAEAPGWATGWLSNSHAFRVGARAVLQRQQALRKLEQGGGLPVDLRVYAPDSDPIWEEAWAVTGALIGEMAARCEAQGVDFAVLLFPDQVQATEAGKTRAVSRWPDIAAWDFDAAQTRAATLAGGHGAALDLGPALSAAQGAQPLYFPDDGHWTALGHQVAAEGSVGFVAEQLR